MVFVGHEQIIICVNNEMFFVKIKAVTIIIRYCFLKKGWFTMRKFAIALLTGFVSFVSVQAGDAAKPQAATVVKAEPVQVVEVARRPLFGRRHAETVMVPSTKTVTVLETKKVLVEKEVKVPVTKEVKTLVPAKVVSSCCDCCTTAVATPVRRLGSRTRGVVTGVAECAYCK